MGQDATRPGILVVDDDETLTLTLTAMLEQEGYPVMVAHDAAAARARLDDFPADIALLDIHLGADNGLELLPEFHRARPNCLCVVMTAYAELDNAIWALKDGASDFIRKPLDYSEVRLLLHRCEEKILLAREREENLAELRRKNEEIRVINARLREIVDSSKKLTVCQDFESLGALILREFAHNMGASGGSLFMCREDHLELLHSLDPGHAPRRLDLPLPEDSVFGQCLRSREPVLIYDIHNDRRVRASGWRGYRDGCLAVYPLPDQQGNIVALIGLHDKQMTPFTRQDCELGQLLASFSCEIIKNLESTERLRRQTELLSGVLANVPHQIYWKSLKGRYRGCNHRFAQWLGRESPAEIEGLTDAELCWTVESAAQLHLAEKRVADAGEFLVNQEMELGIEGREPGLYLSSLAPLRGPDGQVAGILGIFWDITEWRRAQRERDNMAGQLRQAHKMEAIGQLAGGIAHDFNNLLQGILNHTQFAMDGLEPGDARREDLEQVLLAGNTAADLTRQLLAFSRRQYLRREEVDLHEAVTTLIQMLRRLLGEQIEIHFHPAARHSCIHVDRGQFQQVLLNLCVNARDAMPQGGRIDIRTTNVELDEAFCREHPGSRCGHFLRLDIRDSGAGMSEDVRRHIFEPFFTTKEVGKGTGMGLATVYGIVKQHAGYVCVESTPGRGSCFSLFFELIEASGRERPEAERSPDSRGRAPGGDEFVLVAEDEPVVRELTRRVLTDAGYRVEVAVDGEDALRQLDALGEQLDFVILDAVMPKLGGQAVYNQLRRKWPELPVLFASGYSLHSVQTEFILEEKLDIIVKPYASQDLLFRVREMLDRNGKERQG